MTCDMQAWSDIATTLTCGAIAVVFIWAVLRN